jgi:hypothetical protein
MTASTHAIPDGGQAVADGRVMATVSFARSCAGRCVSHARWEASRQD